MREQKVVLDQSVVPNPIALVVFLDRVKVARDLAPISGFAAISSVARSYPKS